MIVGHGDSVVNSGAAGTVTVVVAVVELGLLHAARAAALPAATPNHARRDNVARNNVPRDDASFTGGVLSAGPVP